MSRHRRFRDELPCAEARPWDFRRRTRTPRSYITYTSKTFWLARFLKSNNQKHASYTSVYGEKWEGTTGEASDASVLVQLDAYIATFKCA